MTTGWKANPTGILRQGALVLLLAGAAAGCARAPAPSGTNDPYEATNRAWFNNNLALMSAVTGGEDSPEPAAEPDEITQAGAAPAPVELKSAASRGLSGRVEFRVQVGDADPIAVKLKTDAPLADTAWRLQTALGSLPIDLTGRLTGWVRVEQGGHTWKGHETTGQLDPDHVVKVAEVPARSVPLTLEIAAPDGTLRLTAPVGQAVPAQSLIAHLTRWLELPGSGWRVWVGDTALLPLQILDDFHLQPDATLVIKR